MSGAGPIIPGANGISTSCATLKVGTCHVLPPRCADRIRYAGSRPVIEGPAACVHQRLLRPASGLHRRPQQRTRERSQKARAAGTDYPRREVLQLKWSPAGNLFAIQTVPFGTIVVMEPDGSAPRIVATDAFLGGFSPDGGRLALVRLADGRRRHLGRRPSHGRAHPDRDARRRRFHVASRVVSGRHTAGVRPHRLPRRHWAQRRTHHRRRRRGHGAPHRYRSIVVARQPAVGVLRSARRGAGRVGRRAARPARSRRERWAPQRCWPGSTKES